MNTMVTTVLPMSAGARVANVPELLEGILLNLRGTTGTHTLLLSQRTSKSFQATIAGSTKLQRNLGFAPPLAESESMRYHLSYDLTPAFLEDLPTSRALLSRDIALHWALGAGSKGESVIRLRFVHPLSLDADPTFADRDSCASWRRMHFFACTGEGLERIVGIKCNTHSVRVNLANATLGAMFDLVHGSAAGQKSQQSDVV